MKRLLIAGTIMTAIIMASGTVKAANPFTGNGGTVKSAIDKPGNVNQWMQPVIQFSQTYQKKFKEKLTGFAKQMKTRPFGGAFWLFLWFSFLYGIFHALGPGHGKSIAISYFLSRPGKIMHGFLMGNLLTFSHVFSAVTVIMIIYFILKASGLAAFDRYSGYLTVISTVLLMAVGIYLIGHSIHQFKHWPVEEEGDTGNHPDMKSLVLTSLITGMIPCPGAAIILSYSILTNIILQGLIAMIAVSLGMGLTTSGIALFSILSRQTFMKLVKRNMNLFKTAYITLSCIGASAIILIALFILLSAV